MFMKWKRKNIETKLFTLGMPFLIVDNQKRPIPSKLEPSKGKHSFNIERRENPLSHWFLHSFQ
jgi:hypothetical protein